jgi:translocation and assembly module TamB
MRWVLPSLGRRLRRLMVALLVLIVILVGAFGVLQTSFGRQWLSGVIADVASGPGFSLTITGLEGTIPFAMRAERIEIADDRGAWLVLRHADVDLSAAGLLLGHVDIRHLTFSAIEVERLPEADPNAPATPIFDRLRVPSLPVGVAVEHLAVERLALGPAVLGEKVDATLTGAAVLSGASAHLDLDLRRTDDHPGSIDLRAGLSGTPPVLKVRLTADEPSGLLLAHLLHRNDRPPLAVSFTGEGPLTQWHGRLEATAGSLARLEFDVALAGGRNAVVTIAGSAAAARLLPEGIAPAVGNRVPLRLRATFAASGAITLDELSVELAAGILTGKAAFGGPGRKLRAELRADLPDLAPLSGFLGLPAEGSARLSATLSGSEARPALALDASADAMRLGASGAKRVEAHLTANPSGNLDDPKSQIEMAAQGRVEAVIIPDALAVPADLGRDVDWSVAMSAALDGSTVALSRFTAQGAGLDLAGSGRFAPASGVGNGMLHLAVADLRPLSAALGHRVDGALTIDATASQQPGGRPSIRLNGSLAKLRTAIPAIDALTGGAVTIVGAAEHHAQNAWAQGAWVLDRLAISGSGASVTGAGRFDPAAGRLAGTITAEVPSLQPLAAAVGERTAGRVTGRVSAEGTLDHLKATAQIDGSDLGVGSARLDRLQLKAQVPDLAAAKGTIDGDFRRGDLAGTVVLEADVTNRDEVLIPRFRIAAADGIIEGKFRIDPATLLARGTLSGRMPELARWSRLAGVNLTGSVAIKAELERGRGQNIDLTLTGDRLSWGAGSSRMGLGHLAASANLTDVMGTPAGKAQGTMTALTLSSGSVDQASLSLTSGQPGRFAFTVDAKGRFGDPVGVTIGGEYNQAPGRAGMDLRIARFVGSIGKDRVNLTAPLTLSQRGADYSLANLALAFGSGRITGNAALRGATLSARLTARNLPVAPVARFAGYKGAGTVTLDANFSGTTAAPRGQFTLSGRALSVSLPGQRLPSLSVEATGDWNGRELGVKGRLGGLKGAALNFSGSLPLVLTARPFNLAMPATGRLALRLQGAGDLANIADLLPLGEDRLAGNFTFDAGVAGSIASPAATGHLTITGGRYESFATGAVLTNLQVDLNGDRDRFTLRRLTAGDSANGKLSARGSIVLAGGAGPSVNLTATLTSFRVAARDEAVVVASGEVSVAGNLTSPKVQGRLTVDRADCQIPDSLPPSITRLAVVNVNRKLSRAGRNARSASALSAAARSEAPALALPLDIQITLPGRVFVRGHGLDSEWRGRLKIGGTSAAPAITGTLEAVRGTFDILGKSFRLTRGTIAFDGGEKFDPLLDIATEVIASDITAQALISGVASAPTIRLTSTPQVPQDEILSRVLFGRGLGQITVGEGLQVAQAAATLAGGGPGILDRLRTSLGLDRLNFGALAPGPASSNLNPAAGGSATSGTTISGGKYVADGVFVGATQGTTPQSSKVTVEIEVRRHLTVETDLSRTGGSGIGLNYKYDY